MSETYNFSTMTKGDTAKGVVFTIVVNSVPLSLVDATIKMDVRNKITQEQLLRLDNGSFGGLTISDPVNGVLEFDEQVVDIPPGNHVYDIEITLATGVVKTYIAGVFPVRQDVTYG